MRLLEHGQVLGLQLLNQGQLRPKYAVIQQYNSLSMKKLQLKIPANKTRLQINRAKFENGQSEQAKVEPFKENLNMFGKLQQKEEKGCKVQRLPSVHGSPFHHPPCPATPQDLPPATKKKSAISLHAAKQNSIRRSASTDLSKNSQVLDNEQEDLSQAIKELIILFQRKRMKGYEESISPSSSGLQGILRYIITNKNNRENSNMTLSKNRLKQETGNETVFKRIRKSSFAGEGQGSSKTGFKICSKNVDLVWAGTQAESGELALLREECKRLLSQKSRAQLEMERLKQRIEEQKSIIYNFQLQKQSLSGQILKISSQLQKMRTQIEENREMLTKTEAKRFEIETFVHSQPNQIVKQAAEYHKNLEIDLFQFADYLRHHPLGKKEFQPSIYYNEIERMMGVQLKQMIKFLAEDKKEKCDKKCDALLKFLEKLKHQYKLMNNQLTHAIEEKTKYIEKFSKIMFLWFQNYLTKKEYLENLKQGFALEVAKIEEGNKVIKAIQASSGCSFCSTTKNQVSKIAASVQKVVELYSMGNSFY